MTVRMKFLLKSPWLLFIALTATICAIEFWIVTSTFFIQDPEVLTLGIMVDIALGIPILYYILAVRKKRAPFITLVPIIVISLVLAGLILPAEQHAYLDLIKTTLPLLELIALGYIAAKIRTITKTFHELKTSHFYFGDALRESCKRVLGKLPGSDFILTEFALLYFAFGGWFKKFENSNPNNVPFSYHRKSGYAAILGVIVLVLITETLALHLLLQQWSGLAAWILTSLGMYGLIWMLGDYHAMRLHPIVLSDNTLFLRTGLRWRIDLLRDNIAAIEKFHAREQRGKEYLSLAIFGAPHWVIICKQPVLVRGLFGIKRVVSRIGLTVDDERSFIESLQQRNSSEV